MPSVGIASLGKNGSCTFSFPAGAHVWTVPMSAECFAICLDRLDCALLLPVTARACTTFVIALRSIPWCVCIARERTSNGACLSYPPTWVTHTSPILTGISPAPRNYWERRGSVWRRDGEVFYEEIEIP